MTGYKSKKAMAEAKLEDDDTQVYQDHPAQEPVANDRALQLVTYQMNHWRVYALELQERLVKYEGGAPMLLNKEKNNG